jgi:hypothetical protein
MGQYGFAGAAPASVLAIDISSAHTSRKQQMNMAVFTSGDWMFHRSPTEFIVVSHINHDKYLCG